MEAPARRSWMGDMTASITWADNRTMHTSAPAVPSRTTQRSRSGLRAMLIGQHVIALILIVVGAIRAVSAGTPAPIAILAGLALVGGYLAGIVVARMGTTVTARWWLVAMGLLWIAAVVVSPEFVWVAFSLWLLAGHLLPLWPAIGFSAAVLVVVLAAPFFAQGWLGMAQVIGPVVGGLFAFVMSRGYLQLVRDSREREQLVDSLTRAHAELADLQEELAMTQRHAGEVAERTRLARDIHDTIAQGLSSIRLLCLAVVDKAPEPGGRTLHQVETIATESLADVRRIVAALAPAELEDDALAAALSRLVERMRAETDIETGLQIDETLPPLGTRAEVALLRTAQSALANVRLHANAKRVAVSLLDAGDSVRLDIVDDGSGFDVAAWAAGVGADTSFGLGFMRDRLRSLGGGLDVESSPGQGTALSAYLPLGIDDHRKEPAAAPVAGSADETAEVTR